MANSLLTTFIFSIIIGHGVLHIQASHIHVISHKDVEKTYPPNPTYKTAFHFQPPKNWMNDKFQPHSLANSGFAAFAIGWVDAETCRDIVEISKWTIGDLVFKGIYHLFYQYNPKGADWGNIVWAHSTSLDLVNWTPHPAAIAPSDKGDVNGCWSGSATFLPGGKPAILYTGINAQNQQVQDLAVPKNLSDPYLIEWVKNPKNPLMTPTTMNQINASSFRDPTTAWLGPDKKWRTIIGSKHHRTGLAILYRSKDFVHWTKAKTPLHYAKNTGMWECPDFYPVSVSGRVGVDTSKIGSSVKHVLKLSLDDTKHDYYTIGTYNINKDVYTPDKGSVDNDAGLKYDYGKFYASKTFYDDFKNRRILWGWINESLPRHEYVKQGWSGVQAIPRNIFLDKSGKQLVQWPVFELENLRTNKVDLPTKVLKGGSILEIPHVTAAQADVEISFEGLELEKAEKLESDWTNPQELCSRKGATVKGGLGPFGLKVLASSNQKEYTAVFFRVFKAANKHVVLMCSDQSKSSLNKKTDKTTYGAFVDVDPAHGRLSLRSLIDHSIVESFGGEGKVCITARVYPKLAIGEKAKLFAFNSGKGSVKISKLSAWSMKKATM